MVEKNVFLVLLEFHDSIRNFLRDTDKPKGRVELDNSEYMKWKNISLFGFRSDHLNVERKTYVELARDNSFIFMTTSIKVREIYC